MRSPTLAAALLACVASTAPAADAPFMGPIRWTVGEAAPSLAPRLEAASRELVQAAETTTTAADVRERLRDARVEVTRSGGNPAWIDPFAERARADDVYVDAERILLDASLALERVADDIRALRDVERSRAAAEEDVAALVGRLKELDEFSYGSTKWSEPGAFERLMAWVRLKLVDRLGSRTAAALSVAVAWLVRVVLLLLAITLAVWAVVRVRRALLERGDRSERVVATGRAAPDAPAVDEGLDALVAAGRFREALRAVHRETWTHLAERSAVDASASRTHWESFRQLARRSAAAPDVLAGIAALNRRFDEAWYGHAEVDRGGFERFRDDALRWRGRLEGGAG